MTKNEKEEQINDLYVKILNCKNYLIDTDYKAMKYAEGVEEEDNDVKSKRESARDTINLCQEKINELIVQKTEDEFHANEIIE